MSGEYSIIDQFRHEFDLNQAGAKLLRQLVHTMASRVARHLERQGLLERDAGS